MEFIRDQYEFDMSPEFRLNQHGFNLHRHQLDAMSKMDRHSIMYEFGAVDFSVRAKMLRMGTSIHDAVEAFQKLSRVFRENEREKIDIVFFDEVSDLKSFKIVDLKGASDQRFVYEKMSQALSRLERVKISEFIGAVEPKKARHYGPVVKGRGGKVKKW